MNDESYCFLHQTFGHCECDDLYPDELPEPAKMEE